MRRTIKINKKNKKNKKNKTYNLKLQKKHYGGVKDNLICGEKQLFIDDLFNNSIDNRTALGLTSYSQEKEITAQYRKLAIIFHPDKCHDDRSKVIFIKIKERYDNIISELAPSIQYINHADEISKWYNSKFSTQSSKKEPSFNESLEKSHNKFNEDIIDGFIYDFRKERTNLQNIYDDTDKTIDYKLNIIKKKISNKFKFISLSKIHTLISDVDILITQIDIINNKLEKIQESFATYEIPELQNEKILWLDVQLNGYKPDWIPRWKREVIELKKKATKIKNKLVEKKESNLQRQTRRSAMSNFTERLRYSRKR